MSSEFLPGDARRNGQRRAAICSRSWRIVTLRQTASFTWQGMRVSLDPNYQAPVLGTAGTNKEVATIGDHKGFAIRNIAGMRLSRNVLGR